MGETSIEWTRGDDGALGKTWNPVRGCARVSAGCQSCYAERQAHRFSGTGQPYEGLTVLGKHGPRWSGRARFVPEMLDAPLRWRKPRRVFVNSMSDLFHEDITDEQIAAVFGVMAACPRHTFQVLTKRPERMVEWFAWIANEAEPVDQSPGAAVICGIHASNACADVDYLGLPSVWPLPNVWLGVSCEDQQRTNERIPLLLQCPAAVRFVSAEPLIEPVDFGRWLDYRTHRKCARCKAVCADGLACSHCGQHAQASAALDWIIAGGESGPGARECNDAWLRSIVQQCRATSVPVFVKQLGSHVIQGGELRRKADRKGGDPREWPHDLRVRQFPEARP